MGQFVVFEGIDGSGKSSLARAVCDTLVATGQDAIATREPYGQGLRDNPDPGLTDWLVDRQVHIDSVITPALTEGRWVICDRYILSNLVYQGSVGSGFNTLAYLNRNFPSPDFYFVLELPSSVAQMRIRGRFNERTPSLLELDRLARGYRCAIDYLVSLGTPSKFILLDGTKPLSDLLDVIRGLCQLKST